jgi:hypothetical protein
VKTATELLDEFLNAVEPPLGTAIVLRERKPADKDDRNWDANLDTVVSLPVLSRFESASAELKRQNLHIDWTGITQRNGSWRRIAKFYSERS